MLPAVRVRCGELRAGSDAVFVVDQVVAHAQPSRPRPIHCHTHRPTGNQLATSCPPPLSLQETGDEPMCRNTLNEAREVLPARHPTTLMLINNLAVLLQTNGNLDEAEALFREALEAHREGLCPRHPDTLISINNLAAVLMQKKGELGEAEALFREALEAKRDIHGTRHPDTLMSINSLASVLMQDMCNLCEVELLFREALSANRDMHGTQHTDTLKTIHNLASVLLHDKGNGKLAEVELLFREALEAKRNMLGARDPDTLTSINNLAMLLLKEDKLGEAETLCREALEARHAVLGMQHPDTLMSIRNLMRLLQRKDGRDDVSARGAMARPTTLVELVGPWPDGVAPLDQFREALQLVDEADGRPPNAHILKFTSAELVWDLRHVRYATGDTHRDHEESIRVMIHGGWAESDAVGVELGLHFVSRGIGLAVREHRTVAAAICHGVYASIACVGAHMASPAPDLFVQALQLFECEPSAAAFAIYGTGEGGGERNPVTLCAPFALRDEPHLLTDCGAIVRDDSGYHLAQGDVVCIRSRPNAPPYCRTAALVIPGFDNPEYALPPNTHLQFEEVRVSPWTATFRRWHQCEDETGVVFSDRRDTVFDAERNIHIPTHYRQVKSRGRTFYAIINSNHNRFNRFVDTIDYSPDATFERTVTGCRCIVLVVAYFMNGDLRHAALEQLARNAATWSDTTSTPRGKSAGEARATQVSGHGGHGRRRHDPRLLTHAHAPSASGGGTDSVKEAAAWALGELAGNADNHVAIVRAGAIVPLMALLSGGGADGVKEAAAGALRNLAANADNQLAIAQSGAIAPPMRIGLSEAASVVRAAAELMSKVEAAEVAAASLLAGEEAEKAAAASKKAKSKKKKQRHKQQKGGGSHDQPPSRGAQVAGWDADEEGVVADSVDAADAVDDAASEATVATAAATAAARRVATEKAQMAATEAAREMAEREARRAGAEEAAAHVASLRWEEQEAHTRAAAAAAEQERQMAMARAAADDPPNVIEIRAAELQHALDAAGAQGEVGEGGFGKVFAAELPSLPGWGRVAIKLATSMDPSALLHEVQLLRECRHPNVLPLLCFCGDTRAPCMVTPLMRGGSLDDRLLPSPGASQRLLRLGFNGDPHLSWQQRLSALCDAARGLAHLHASCTLHRDVKTGNILLDGSLQPLQTAGGIIPVYRAFLSDVGLAKVREASAAVGAMTHATTSSVAFSTGFCDPIFINSNQHSERTDAYGIGVSLLMILLGEPANGLLTKWEDEGIADFVEGNDAAVLDRLVAKAVAAAGWPSAVTCGLARVVHGLSVARKSRRQPLPDALDAMEALLQAGGGAANPPEPAPARAMVREEGGAGANGHSGGLTRLVGALDKLAFNCGSDAALVRMQKHVNSAFLSMMTRLEAKYIEQGHSPLPCELSEHNKINALAPRHACPKLNGHAHTLRIWWNAAKHDRGRWMDPPSDREAEEVAQGVMSELARLGW